MSVIVAGLNHRTVPLRVLEPMTVLPARLPKVLHDLSMRDHLSEVVVLSTCMRTEIYAVANRFHGGMSDIRDFLASWSGTSPEQWSDHLYSYYDEGAVRHLYTVASGLDSAVLGEGEILRQVRTAWETAAEEGSAGPTLAALFRHAVETGKRVRAETAIARGTTSLSHAAVAMAGERLGSLAGRTTLLVGAGEMGEAMAEALGGAAASLGNVGAPGGGASAGAGLGGSGAGGSGAGVGGSGVGVGGSGAGVGGAGVGGSAEVLVANRTWSKAAQLAARYGGQAVQWGGIPAALERADVLLTSTGSPDVLLEAPDLLHVLAGRGDRPLLIVDIAVPRDVDPAVGDLPGVTLLDMDDLKRFAEAAMAGRRQEVPAAEAIVAEEIERYLATAAQRKLAPVLAGLRDHGEAIRLAELDRFGARLASLDDRERRAVEALTRGIVAKLLHQPSVNLKAEAGTAGGEQLAQALRALFEL